jgi:hypothetical protein
MRFVSSCNISVGNLLRHWIIISSHKLSVAYFLVRPVQLNQEIHFWCAFVSRDLTIQIKDDALDRAYSTQVNEKFRPENLERRHNLRDLDVDGRIILKCFLQKYAVT